MREYIMICCCLTQEYHKQLPSLLLDKGYMVKPGLDQGSSIQTNGIVTNIIYLLAKEGANSASIDEDVRAALNEIKAYYYSLAVIPGSNDGTIFTGNINGETDISRVLQMKALW